MSSLVTTYQLSSRQRRELSNGKVIRIALPNPEDEPAEPEAWARSILDMPAGTIVRSCEQHNVPVSPLHRGGGLSQLFGELCDTSGRVEYYLVLFVEVIIVELAAGDAPRGRLRTQWPGSVRLPDGRSLPA